jgi:CheY-like chemotaxis protein
VYRILVADDEPEVVDMVQMMLHMEGSYSVVSAADGQETLDKARAEPPDLILLDVRMPKMSGLEVLDGLRSESATAAIPVVMLSVMTSDPEVRDALQRGAVAYLSKPFEMREMTWLVGHVLEMNAAAREAWRQRELRNVGRLW